MAGSPVIPYKNASVKELQFPWHYYAIFSRLAHEKVEEGKFYLYISREVNEGTKNLSPIIADDFSESRRLFRSYHGRNQGAFAPPRNILSTGVDTGIYVQLYGR